VLCDHVTLPRSCRRNLRESDAETLGPTPCEPSLADSDDDDDDEIGNGGVEEEGEGAWRRRRRAMFVHKFTFTPTHDKPASMACVATAAAYTSNGT